MPSAKTRILLVSANKLVNPYPVFPLGIAFLQAALEEDGHEVRIHDQLIHDEKDLSQKLGWAECIGLSLRNVDNVSATDPVSYTESYRELVNDIRQQSSAPIMAGGSAFSIFPEAFMEALGIDFGIQGEAEAAIVQWVRALKDEGGMETVDGLLYHNAEGKLIRNAPVSIHAQALPSPRPDPELIRAYMDLGGMLNAQTQRGCALHCTYCTYPWIEGRCYRHREPADIVGELEHLQAAGARYVFFTDSVFNTSKQHVEAVSRAIIESGLKINWGCFARPCNLDEAMLDLMIEAGLQHIEFGSDSFSDTTLSTYGKSFRFEEILEVSRIASRKNVHACHYIIFGGPGETETTIRETTANARLLPEAPIFAFSGMRIYPHTPLYKQSGERRSPEALLEPAYYTPESLADADREQIIAECTRDNPNWFLSDHADNNEALTTRLRRKGKQGPLWEYMAISRRLRQDLKLEHTSNDLN